MIWTRANMTSGRKVLTFFLLVAIALAILASSPSARAQTTPPTAVLLTVTKTADTNDSFCDPDDCSLREAITEANSDMAHDVVSFTPGFSGSIVLDSALGGLTIQDDPAVSSDLSINGPGAGALSVSGNGAVRPFTVVSGANATIGKISIVNGNATNVGGFGGGIRNQGTLTLNDSTVSGNKADAWGGGVLNLGTLTLNRSTVSGNEASDGGGTANTGTLTLNDSTASGNKADAWGGGIYQANLSGYSTITNSTISGNRASSGGGIDNDEGLTRIENSTTTNNTAISGSGVASTGDNSASTKVFSSIISANANDDDVNLVGGNIDSFTSDGYNLIGGGLTTAFNKPGDRFGVINPGLGPLANNGGPTQTHALKKGSPAINKSTNTGCPATDQRGVSRPQGKTCDIGSYEKKHRKHRHH